MRRSISQNAGDQRIVGPFTRGNLLSGNKTAQSKQFDAAVWMGRIRVTL